MSLHKFFAGLLAAAVVVPAAAGSYHLRFASKGLVGPSLAVLSSPEPGDAFTNVALLSATSAVVTLSNPGSQPLVVQSVLAEGLDAEAEFSQSNDCIGTLPGADQCFITITFAPSSVGVRRGTLRVETDSKSQPSLNLALEGTAIPPPVATLVGGAWSDGTYARSCLEYRMGDAGHTPGIADGIYVIKPAATTYSVTCDMTGGGWTRFDYMVAGYSPFPGNNASVYTQRVQAQYMPMYKELASVSSVQKLLGVSGNSANGDYYSFYTQNKVQVPGTGTYAYSLPISSITLTINGDWTAAFGFTHFRTDYLGAAGSGASIKAQSWFK